MERYEYRCKFASGPAPDWESVEGVELADTVDGSRARLATVVKMCRTASHIHVRFECEDDHIVANYTNRDDPIYKEDVVELFLDESGDGRTYKEYELSPRNVAFDAMIAKEPGQPPKVDTSWDDEGMKTSVVETAPGRFVYELALPVEGLSRPPAAGTVWRANFYRIDGDPQGKRHYWAWSPTGKVDFHRPEHFGTIELE